MENSTRLQLADAEHQAASFPVREQTARAIAVTSGKGGVGKTNITLNLGIALAARGAKVCVFDADTNLANINVLLGLSSDKTVEHVLNGECSIDEILIDGPRGVKIVPAASGIADLVTLSEKQHQTLVSAFEQLERQFDFLLVDTAAGIGDGVLHFLRVCHEVLLVITPEPTSLTDAFSLLKVLRRREIALPISVLVNRVPDHIQSVKVFRRFAAAAEKYLHMDVDYFGHIVPDDMLATSVRLQRPVILLKHDAPSSRCFYSLAQKVHKEMTGNTTSFSNLWRTLVQDSDTSDHPGGSAKAESSLPAALPQQPGPEMANNVLQWITDEATTAEEAEEVLRSLLDGFLERFNRFPFDLRKSLYQALEMEDFPVIRAKELLCALEMLYELHRQPPRDPDADVARLFRETKDREQRYLDLYRRFRASYERQFHRPFSDPSDPKSDIAQRIENDDFDRQSLAALLQTLTGIYRRRFRHPRDKV